MKRFQRGLKQCRRLAAILFVLSVTAKSPAAGENTAEPWTLGRALEMARESNPDVRLAMHRIAAARAGVEQANAAFWPKFQFQSSYTATDNPVAVFGTALNQRSYSPSLNFNNVPDADDLNVEGRATLSLYSGGRNQSVKDAAHANVQASEQEAEAVRLALEYEVARAFFTVVKTREFVKAAAAAAESFEHNLTLAHTRFESGAALKTDVLDLEVRLAQAREDLLRAENAHELAGRAFLNLLGLEAEGSVEVTDPVKGLETPDTGDYSQRPELAAAQHRNSAAEAEVRRAQGGYYPDFSLFGSVDYDRGWKFDGDGTSYTAGVMLQWNLWDGHLTRSRVSEARVNFQTAREQKRKLQLAIGLEVEQARLNYETARARLEVTAKAVAQAEESARLTRSRFEQGLAIGAQLFDAETALTSARVRHAEAEADYQIATAAMRKAVGLPQMPTPDSR